MTVRDLRVQTTALLKEVVRGQTFVIENRGVPVAELRPITQERRSARRPDREALIGTLPVPKNR